VSGQRPQRPVALIPKPEQMPTELTVLHRWVGWRYEYRDGANGRPGKWTKVPRNCRTGAAASSTEEGTWSTFEEAVAAYERGGLDGIGITLAPPLVGVDLDHVLDRETGAIVVPEAARIVQALESYTERSPGGDGLRIFVFGALPTGRRKVEHYRGIPCIECTTAADT
jgi:putative DNA primase/helicase